MTDKRSTASSTDTPFELPASGSSPAGRELAEQLVEQARVEGVDLVGPGGLLGDLTKRVLEAGLEAEMTDHLGYERHDPAGRDGGNSRNGTRSKTVVTDVGPVELDVPRDRHGSFDPKLVRKRQPRLGGVDEMVIYLTAKGLTTGEVQAHLAEVYGTDVSRETISKITDAILGEIGSVSRSWVLASMPSSRGFWAGSRRRWGPRMQACSWMQAACSRGGSSRRARRGGAGSAFRTCAAVGWAATKAQGEVGLQFVGRGLGGFRLGAGSVLVGGGRLRYRRVGV